MSEQPKRINDFCSGRNNTKATPRAVRQGLPRRPSRTYLSTSCARRVTRSEETRSTMTGRVRPCHVHLCFADKSRMSVDRRLAADRTSGGIWNKHAGTARPEVGRSGTGTPLPFCRPVQSSPSASGLECVFRSRSSPRPCLGCNLIDKREEGPRKQKPSGQQLSVTKGPSHTVAQLERGFIGDGGRVSHLARPERKAKKQAKLPPMLARCSRLPLPVLGQPMSAPAHWRGGLGDTH